ncbi:MAG: flagellar biosynthetic protein FliO [Candidatus Marinimicrobia bacterium]|nr:flagellar biosynthetic protein FliO [Candidatus Neomarinimicrobiota bacterium]
MISKEKYSLAKILALTVAVTLLIIGISMRSRAIEDRSQPAPAVEAVAGSQDQDLPAPSTADDLTSALWKTVTVTAILLAMILIGARTMKKYWGGKLGQVPDSNIKIIGRKYLNPKQSLVMVNVRDRDLLIGVTDQNINLICDLSTGEELDDTAEFGELVKSGI